MTDSVGELNRKKPVGFNRTGLFMLTLIPIVVSYEQKKVNDYFVYLFSIFSNEKVRWVSDWSLFIVLAYSQVQGGALNEFKFRSIK